MVRKFPIWIYVVLALQFLLALAACAFAILLGSAFSGEVNLGFGQLAFVFGLLALPVLALWLARTQWRAERSTAAYVLAFAPIVLISLIGAAAELLMA